MPNVLLYFLFDGNGKKTNGNCVIKTNCFVNYEKNCSFRIRKKLRVGFSFSTLSLGLESVRNGHFKSATWHLDILFVCFRQKSIIRFNRRQRVIVLNSREPQNSIKVKTSLKFTTAECLDEVAHGSKPLTLGAELSSFFSVNRRLRDIAETSVNILFKLLKRVKTLNKFNGIEWWQVVCEISGV